MRLTIIIVSYNTAEHLINCLSSIGLKHNFEVIVVDNHSHDATVMRVKKNFPQVKLIVNEKNLGFAKANNIGLRIARGSYILLLNSDTKVRKDSLIGLLNKAQKIDKLGVLGCKLIGTDGKLQPSVGFAPHLQRIFFWMSFIDDIPYLSRLVKSYHVNEAKFYTKDQEVDWVSGAALLVSREAVIEAGLMDEKIFMYGEEVEWCYRIKRAGFKILYTPNVSILHLKGASGEGKDSGILEEFKALAYFYRKHKSLWQYPILLFLLRFGALLRLILFGIIGIHQRRRALYAKAFQLAR